MQKIKKDKQKIIPIPALHTYLIKEYDNICQQFKIQLLQGAAEINGIQIMKHYPHTYTLPCCLPVFTWQSCKIKIYWKQQDGTKPSDEDWCDLTEFHSHQDPMIKYLELHYELTCLRKLALEQIKQGPRLAIIGSENSGTQLVTKLMLNYTGKLNMKPIFIDLDVQNSIFIDGTFGSLVFEYKICEDFLIDLKKYVSFMEIEKLKKIIHKANYINCRNIQQENQQRQSWFKLELKSYKQKGSNIECPSFASGLILHCPRILQKYDKKNQKQLIYEILKIFKIGHVLSVDDSQIPLYLSKNQPKIQKFNLPKLQGTNSFIQLPKPLKTKINRYFQPQIIKSFTVKIGQVHLYEFMQPQGKQPYCRQIKIQQQPIAKSTISILYCDNNLLQSKQIKAQKALQCPISCLAFIYRIGKDQITLHALSQTFWQDCKNKLWMSMISQSSSI